MAHLVLADTRHNVLMIRPILGVGVAITAREVTLLAT
jgi:hypothetical protein